ncbi:hypothetical protein Tco_0071548 [Tanacetum coccineum]
MLGVLQMVIRAKTVLLFDELRDGTMTRLLPQLETHFLLTCGWDLVVRKEGVCLQFKQLHYVEHAKSNLRLILLQENAWMVDSHVMTTTVKVAHLQAPRRTALTQTQKRHHAPGTGTNVRSDVSEESDKKLALLMVAKRQAENKRKLDNNNQTQQQLSKRQNVAQAYAAGTGERKEYAGTLPLCNKCKFHHNGPCTVKCANCKRVGHLTRDCWSSAATNNQRTLTCYECGNQGHYRSDCPELKNRNHGNQAEGTEARGMVYALEGGDTDQDLNNIEDEIEA